MKLTHLTFAFAILLASSAFAADDHVGQAQSNASAASASAVDWDKTLRDYVEFYDVNGKEDYKVLKTAYWWSVICSSDGFYRIGTYSARKNDPNHMAIIDSVRASMHKYLHQARDKNVNLTEKIGQDWRAIPASEKENFAHMDGQGFDFANDLATDCHLVRVLLIGERPKFLSSGMTNCTPNGEPLDLDALDRVCHDIAPHRPIGSISNW